MTLIAKEATVDAAGELHGFATGLVRIFDPQGFERNHPLLFRHFFESFHPSALKLCRLELGLWCLNLFHEPEVAPRLDTELLALVRQLNALFAACIKTDRDPSETLVVEVISSLHELNKKPGVPPLVIAGGVSAMAVHPGLTEAMRTDQVRYYACITLWQLARVLHPVREVHQGALVSLVAPYVMMMASARAERPWAIDAAARTAAEQLWGELDTWANDSP